MEKINDQKIFLGSKKMRTAGKFSREITIPPTYFKLTKVDKDIHFDIYLNPKNNRLIIEPHKTVYDNDSGQKMVEEVNFQSAMDDSAQEEVDEMVLKEEELQEIKVSEN